MNIQKINVKTAVSESAEKGEEIPVTAPQFLDLYQYVCENGTYSGWSGMDWQTLSRYQEIAEPGNPAEGVTLYLTGGWPVAVYAFDTGYTVIRGALLAAR